MLWTLRRKCVWCNLGGSIIIGLPSVEGGTCARRGIGKQDIEAGDDGQEEDKGTNWGRDLGNHGREVDPRASSDKALIEFSGRACQAERMKNELSSSMLF